MAIIAVVVVTMVVVMVTMAVVVMAVMVVSVVVMPVMAMAMAVPVAVATASDRAGQRGSAQSENCNRRNNELPDRHSHSPDLCSASIACCDRERRPAQNPAM